MRKTLASVAAQTYRDIEHIIVDGGSTDGSVDIIRDYEETIHHTPYTIHLIWLSEKDNGIYDAMNKGVEKASGDYLYFLNSGDAFATPDVVQEMMKIFDGTDIIIGRVNRTNNGKVFGQTNLLSEKDMSLYKMYLGGINHQSALIRRELLVETPYDATIKYGADWKFFVQTIVLKGATTKFVDEIFANYDVAGLSSNTPEVRKERETILKTILPERVARDYLAIAPHYYEVTRVEWLLRHPFWYKIYRMIVTFARKISNL